MKTVFCLFSLLKIDFFFPYQEFATILAEAVTSLYLPVAVINLKEYDPDDNLVEEVGNCFIFFSVKTHI